MYEDQDTDSDVITQQKLEKPKMYKVLLLNDDFTPMDFVILILKRFFSKNSTDAEKIMLNIHNQGSGLAGVYTRELAETKVFQVHQFSKQHNYPLRCTIEIDD